MLSFITQIPTLFGRFATHTVNGLSIAFGDFADLIADILVKIFEPLLEPLYYACLTVMVLFVIAVFIVLLMR